MRRWLSRFKPWVLVIYRPSGTLTVPYWTRRTAYQRLQVWELAARTGDVDEVDVYVRRRR